MRHFIVVSTLLLLSRVLAGDALQGRTHAERLKEVRDLIEKKDGAKLAAIFYGENDPELVVVAGQALIGDSNPDDLQRVLGRLVTFPGPLPAMNLGGVAAQHFGAQQFRKELLRVNPPNWWSLRNYCLMAESAPDPSLVQPLYKVYAATTSRPVKLEAILAISKNKSPLAVKALEAIYVASDFESERSACMMGLAACGAETDVPWILQQLSENEPESIVGAWTITELTTTLPRDVTGLLSNKEILLRRAGLVILQKLATAEQWMALLRNRGTKQTELLEAIGNYFTDNPSTDAAKEFIATSQYCNDKDYRVSEAWCRALGACAAAGDAKLQDEAVKIFNSKFASSFAPLRKEPKERKEVTAAALMGREQREGAIPAIYGLANLGTEAAKELLLKVAIESNEDVVAEYAAMDVLRSKDSQLVNKLQFALGAKLKGNKTEFLRAVDLLSLMPQTAAVDLLIEALGHADTEDSKLVVREALSRATGHDMGPKPDVWAAWWKNSNHEFFEQKVEKVPKGAERPAFNPPPRPEKTDDAYKNTDPRSLDLFALRKKQDWSLAQFGGDMDTEDSVAEGLRWLADHQDPDGKWSGFQFTDLNVAGKGEPPSQDYGQPDIGITGLSVLAFLANNHTQLNENSIYRETVSRALGWFHYHQLNDGAFEEVSGVRKQGKLGDKAKRHTAEPAHTEANTRATEAVAFFNYYNYQLAISTLALTEAYALTGEQKLKFSAQKCLDKIYSSQLPGEGWRYAPRRQTDTSVMGWMVMAVKSGLMAGLSVDPRCRESVTRYFDRTCTRVKFSEEPQDDARGYGESVGAGYKDEEAWCTYLYDKMTFKATCGPIAGLCRMFLGYNRAHPYNVGVANYLRRHPPLWAISEKAGADNWAFPIYALYHGTVFMHQMGGDDWNTWNRAMKKTLLTAQIKAPNPNAGAFPLLGTDAQVAGQVYSTAMCVLTLETYYRYLPMLWFGE